ncbi:hypothetical protein X798_07366 [Onchocerca flexuosa]|uniref:Uncharacterized protein n=1 Tax=Onchocerca flexuosa TaxID=387005 RepID=A0A238BLX4_9BILA|nr:hypothetical protein X798_07366 [Onchocerca flexuosa]
MYEEEQNEKISSKIFKHKWDLQMKKLETNEDEEPFPNHAGTSNEGSMECDNSLKFFEGHKKGRKRVRENTLEQPERLSTPMEG